MDKLKHAVVTSPAIRPIDLTSNAEVGLCVDTLYKAVGFYIYQVDEKDPTKRYYVRFGSITMNEREARFSQPKTRVVWTIASLKGLSVLAYWNSQLSG